MGRRAWVWLKTPRYNFFALIAGGALAAFLGQKGWW